MGMEAPDSTGGHCLCHMFALVHEVSEVGELIQVSHGPDPHLLAGFRGRVNNNVLLLACLRICDGDDKRSVLYLNPTRHYCRGEVIKSLRRR